MTFKKGFHLDKRVWDKLKKEIKGDLAISAGVNERDATPYPENPEVTTADVAMFHELGTVKMEARPFIEPGTNNQIVADHMANAAKAILEDGRTERKALESVAPYVEQQIRTVIREKNILDTGLLTRTVSAIVKSNNNDDPQ